MTPLVIGLVLLFFAACVFLNHRYGYWKRRNIPQLTPIFPFGNFLDLFRCEASFPEVCEKLYKRSKQWPLLGGYVLLRPVLFVNDPQLAKDILVRDFQHFQHRGTYVDEENDPLGGHLFALAGEKWKHLRTKLTPTFTSGKLKAMFQTLLDTGVVLENFIQKHAECGAVVEIREILARYTTDIIASVSFGIQIDSINNPNDPFRQMGRKSSLRNNMRILLTYMVPKLNKYLKLKTNEDVERFMLGVVRETLEYREQHGITRKDMMQLLLQLRNSGTVSDDDQWDVDASNQFKELSLEEVAAQAHVFFQAGFETSSSTMSFCLYELAKNSTIRRKVQQEIDSVKEHYGGELTYDGIMEMRYLECCIDETLRKYPPVPILNRECTQDYKVSGSHLVVQKGTAVVLQIGGMQHDAQYYPEPMRFEPERFQEANMRDKPYAPFGDGPRVCIGKRMGKMLTKVGLSLLLARFDFELSEHTESKLLMKSNNFVPTPVEGINLKISCRC